MRETGDKLVDDIQKRLNHGLKIIRVEDGLIFEHRNATYYLAEVDLKGAKITVPMAAEFRNHPDYDGDELIEHAMKELKPRLLEYHQRGYEIRETDWIPRHQVGAYDDRQVPTFVAFLERYLDDWEELYDELEWLLTRLPDR